MAKETILLVDDEAKIILVLKAYLEEAGYRVLTARDGREALTKAEAQKPDLILLDLMLPVYSGEEVCRRLRKDSRVPIIMLTAKAEAGDRVEGLGLGADDYIVKPFSPQEVLARIKAVLRRSRNDGARLADILTFSDGDLVVDTLRHEVWHQGEQLHLTPTEFKILSAMARSPGRVFSREQLTDIVHGYAYDGFERTIDAHIKNLRQKLEGSGRQAPYIQTVYGAGYRFAGE
jgi:two-component system, OmpR family, response regulator ResD